MARSDSRFKENAALREPLARRFLSDAGEAVWAHPILALVLAAFLLGNLGPASASLLVALVFAGTVLRLVLHRAAREASWNDPGVPLAWTRASTAALAAAWGGVALLVLPSVPTDVAVRLLVLYASLTGAAVISHRADPPGFQLYAALLLLPAVVAFVLVQRDLPRSGIDVLALDILLLMLFWGAATLFNRRTHAQLDQSLRSTLQLQRSIAAATREQDFVSAVLNGVPHALAVLDPDGRVARSSLAFQALVALDGETLAGTPADQLGDDPFWAHLNRIGLLARAAGQVEEEVIIDEGRTLDGSAPCYFLISAAAGGNAATGWVVLLVEDLTPIRQAEIARRRAEAEYEDLVQSAHDLIWKTDLQANWSYLNAAAGEIYGESPVDLLGTSAIDRAMPENRAADRAAFVSVIGGGDLVNHETVHRTANGGTRVLSFSGRAILDDDNRTVGIQGVARDITEWKEAEDKVRRMAAEAAEATRMKSAFLANMSHEIRTPMNGVLGMAELLLGTDLDEEQRQFLEIIRGSGENLLRLLNEILDFSKIEAGHLELEDIPLALGRTLEDAVLVLKTVALQNDNQLRFELDPELPEAVRGDPGRLNQVVTNLVSNALKFTHSGTVTVRARRASSVEGDDLLQVSVEDTGVGISKDKQKSVFGEFSQADTSVTRKFGGTGLGLTISRRLVELMGGEIRLESEEGRGSAFTFDIPLRAVDPGELPRSSPTAAVHPEQTGGGARGQPGVETVAAESARGGSPDPASDPPHILLAEDTPVNRQVATAVLHRAGFRVTEVEDGTEAVAAVRDGAFDLVLMDIQMPLMDGLDATRAIRQGEDTDTGSIPILALTAQALPEERIRCLDAGMNDFLSKPFKPETLVAMIHRWLGPRDSLSVPPAHHPDTGTQTPNAPPDGSGPGPNEPLPAAATTATEAPPVMLAEFRATMTEAGIGEVVDTMLDLFMEELPGRRTDLHEAGAAGDTGALAFAAHALKSSAGNIRADELLARLKTLEAAARDGDLEAARRGLEDAMEEIERVRSYLEAAR